MLIWLFDRELKETKYADKHWSALSHMRSLTASHRGHADRAASVCSRLKKFQTGSKDTRGRIALDEIQVAQIQKKGEGAVEGSVFQQTRQNTDEYEYVETEGARSPYPPCL